MLIILVWSLTLDTSRYEIKLQPELLHERFLRPLVRPDYFDV